MNQETGKREIYVGIMGMGTVGGGVVSLLNENGADIAEKVGASIVIKKILVRDVKKRRAVYIPEELLTDDPEVFFSDPDIHIYVELTGGIEPACTNIAKVLKKGKYVVTANKDLMAQHGDELIELSRHSGGAIFFEGSVGGGIPLIRPLQQCLAANRIDRLMGIINGTTNYILTRMSLSNIQQDEALKEAQEKGFAEADPSSDIEGRDAAYKMVVLAKLAFGASVPMDKVYMQGIESVSAEDLLYARQLGYTIKLLAVGERFGDGLSLRVFPALLPLKHPLAAVYYEYNALFVEGNAVGEVMFYGRGAGAMPTASAVSADIIAAARLLRYGSKGDIQNIPMKKMKIISGDEMVSSFYLRLQAYDRPGVFASLATIFSAENVSLDMILQKRSDNGIAEIVLVTYDVKEACFFEALNCVKQMPSISSINGVFRVIGKP